MKTRGVGQGMCKAHVQRYVSFLLGKSKSTSFFSSPSDVSRVTALLPVVALQ